jgi:hypothetical protein
MRKHPSTPHPSPLPQGERGMVWLRRLTVLEGSYNSVPSPLEGEGQGEGSMTLSAKNQI